MRKNDKILHIFFNIKQTKELFVPHPIKCGAGSGPTKYPSIFSQMYFLQVALYICPRLNIKIQSLIYSILMKNTVTKSVNLVRK